MDSQERAWILQYQPHIYRDRLDPFPIRYLGCTVFTEKQPSLSFPKWAPDPAACGARAIIEYAIYYDYDIQHMYDLEHIWVAIGDGGEVVDCWCSFHGMRLRAAGLPCFRLEGSHPVLYAQPGKHAFLPDPGLLPLHPQFYDACGALAGGGLLIPDMFRDVLTTTPQLDARIRSHIRSHYAFTPSLDYVPEPLAPEQLISWQQLRQRIPVLVRQALQALTE